jgi:hypothetical protein
VTVRCKLRAKVALKKYASHVMTLTQNINKVQATVLRNLTAHTLPERVNTQALSTPKSQLLTPEAFAAGTLVVTDRAMGTELRQISPLRSLCV